MLLSAEGIGTDTSLQSRGGEPCPATDYLAPLHPFQARRPLPTPTRLLADVGQALMRMESRPRCLCYLSLHILHLPPPNLLFPWTINSQRVRTTLSLSGVPDIAWVQYMFVGCEVREEKQKITTRGLFH